MEAFHTIGLARIRFALVLGGSHRILLPGVSSAPVGKHGPFRRSRFCVPCGQVPTGGWDGRLYLHASGDDRRSLPSCVQTYGYTAEEESALELAGVYDLGTVACGRSAADFHFLTRPGGPGSI